MPHLSPFHIPAGIQAKADEIMAASRARFGHDAFRMEGDGGDTGGDSGDDGKTGEQDDKSGSGGDDKAAGQSGEQGDKGDDDKTSDDPWADPLKAKAEIERLRRENASSRTDAKKKAADDARADLTQQLGKALGLIKDDDKTKVDPADLTRQLTDSQQKARQAQVELTVYRTASKHQGDPDALLDSRAFLEKVADLDPSDEKFQSKVDAAVKAAVDDNPKLKAGQAPGSSAADHPGGSGGGGAKPKSLEEAVTKKMAS